jgi:hypothetical protein
MAKARAFLEVDAKGRVRPGKGGLVASALVGKFYLKKTSP